jgi:hypothetical protein
MALTPSIALADLQQSRAIADKEGRPSTELLRLINGNTRNVRQVLLALVNVVTDQQALLDAIVAAQTAAADAQAAANTAITAADSATTTLSQIESGTFDVDAVTIGGTRFINSGGTLVAEP